MEKETLIQNLKAKIGDTDFGVLSARTVESIVTPLLPMFADDTKVTDETYALPVSLLKSYIGQYRHDVASGITTGKTQWEREAATARETAIAEAVANAKKEWEAAGKGNEANGGGSGSGTDVQPSADDLTNLVIQKLSAEDSPLGKISKQMADFLKAQADRDKAATEASVREDVRNHLLSLGVEEDDFALEYTLEHLVIGEKPDRTALKASAKASYEENYKRIYGNKSVSPLAGGGGGQDDSTAEFNKFIAERKAAEEAKARDAEALRKMLV